MGRVVIKAEDISKQYRLGMVGTGTVRDDLNRWWHTVRGKEDPFLKIGETNDRSTKGESDYVWSLQDINFEVQQGDSVGIIGRNGAGKSTLLKILSQVTQPTTGRIYTKGRIASLLEVGTGFHPEMTGRENIYLNGAILGMRKHEITRKFDEIVAFSGVERYIDTPVKRYSSGMYVRLAFAVAAYLESEILIVDEVLAVGDAEFQKKCLGKMNDVSKGEGRTVLFVSHNMAAVKSLCDSAILLENGKIVKEDTSEKVINYYNGLNQEINKNNKLFISKGLYNLTLHQNKKVKDYGLLKAEVYSDGQLSDSIANGCQLDFILHYKIDRDFYSAEIGLVIKDKYDLPYIGLNNKHLGKEFHLKKGEGKVKISIPNFPLYFEDEIIINLYFGDLEFDKYEILENVIYLNLNKSDVYKSGKLLDIRWNKLTINNINIEML